MGIGHSEIQVEKLDKLSRSMGLKQASLFLSNLGKDRKFVSAIETQIGQEIYSDLILSAEDLLKKIINEKDEPKDRAELRAYLNIMSKWNDKINGYHAKKQKFDEVTK